jgi:hypothetical protein
MSTVKSCSVKVGANPNPDWLRGHAGHQALHFVLASTCTHLISDLINFILQLLVRRDNTNLRQWHHRVDLRPF